MNAQLDMSPYPAAAAWCSENPAAEIAAVCKANEINEAGREASMAYDIVPFLLKSAKQLQLVRRDGSPYPFDRNIIPALSRHLEWKHGCRMTKRKAACDKGQHTYATPDVRRAS